MKKIFSLLLVVSMILSLCACGGNTISGPSNENPVVSDTKTENNDSAQTNTKLNAENTITIEGKQYMLPMLVKDFLDSGWNDTYNQMGETIGADKGLQYPSFSLDKNGEEKISGIGAYNYTDGDISIKEAALISLKLVGVSDDSSLTQCSFTLPCGITEKSTYEDVCAAYGTKTESEKFRVSDGYEENPKDAEAYKKYGFTMQFTTKDATASPYNYIFSFNADNTIKYVQVESADFRLASTAAFGNI